MSQHHNLGDIAIPVGSYTSNGATKKRYRHIGTLMETVEDDGTRRRWLRLNLDIFHASLYAMARATGSNRGDDSITAAVFEPREPNKPAPAASAEEEPGPF